MRNKISILLIALTIVSCKTTKTISKQGTQTTNQSLELVKLVQKTQPSFRTANISKLSVELVMSDRTVNVSANCKIRKDSAIFSSFQVFGLEVFKAELMPDSIKVFDKMNRRYYVSDYTYFRKQFGVDVDFHSLQSLLLAQLFNVGKKELQPSSYKLTSAENGMSNLQYISEGLVQNTNISSQNIIQGVELRSKTNSYQLQTKYSNYVNQSGINFPQLISIIANNNNKTKATCNLSILKVEFNTAIKFQALATDRYSRGSIDQILKK